MKILKLLQELYLELREYNEQTTKLEELYTELKTFNSNVEYFNLLKTEARRNRANPIRTMNEFERLSLKKWINERLKEKGISFNGEGYGFRQAREFIIDQINCAGSPTRQLVASALGYGSFEELLEAYRETKGAV